MENRPLIQIVEDDLSFATFLKTLLEEAGYAVCHYTRAEEALLHLPEESPAISIVDLKLPGLDGIQYIERAKRISPYTEFLIITAFGSIPSAVSALKKGAIDYLTKPLESPEDFLRKIKTLLESRKPQISRKEEDLPPFHVLFAGMEELYEKILSIAPTSATVLLLGETGTGKSAIAKAIHVLSNKKGAFVEVNCAVLPENLVEAELFGYEKGAFTGATKTKPGKLELARDGTLFLDEIAEMTPQTQAKFLRVLQNRTFERLGGLEVLETNARFVVATNRNLEELVKKGQFREDLYYRINVISFNLPPLRVRKAHLSLLIDYIIEKKAKKLGVESRPLSKKSLEKLMNYPFPGNVRELENILERALLLSKGPELEVELPALTTSKEAIAEIKPLKELEKEAILKALSECKGNKVETAKKLGIPLRTLYHKLKEYEIKS